MLRKLAVRGIEMELEDAGSGERAFVLVHGFTGSRDDFREHVPELARLGRTIALDQRGHGGTSNSGRHEASPRPMPLPIPEPVRAALVDLVRSQGVAALLPGMRQRPDDQLAPALRRSVEQMGPDVFWERVRRKLDAMDPVAWDALLRVLGEHEAVTDRLAEIRCPTLVMVGAEDAPFLAPADELERGIPGAERVTIERAAHSPQLENPSALSAAIRAHLARVR